MIRSRLWPLRALPVCVVGALLAMLVAVSGVGGCEPGVRFTSPPSGSFIPTSSVSLAGSTGGAPVSVNGVEARIEGSDWFFEALLPTGPRFHPFLALRPDGRRALRSVISGTALPAGEFSSRGLAFRITEHGLTALALAFSRSDLLDFEKLVRPGDEFGDLEVEQASSRSSSVKINMVDDRVRLRISLFDVEIEGEAKNQGPFNEDCNVRIETDRITANLHIELRPVRKNGTFVVGGEVERFGLDLGNLDADVSGCGFTKFLGDLVGDVEDDVRAQFDDGVADFLGEQEFAKELRAVTDLLSDVSLDVDAPLASAREDEHGITLVHDVAVGSTERAPGAPQLGASLAGGASDPHFSDAAPEGGAPYGFAVAISTSALNQLLRAETQGGLLREDLLMWDPGDPEPAVSVLLADLGHADPAQPLWLKIDPRLAPLAEPNPAAGAAWLPVEIGRLQLSIWNGTTGALRARIAAYLPLRVDLQLEEALWRPSIGAPDPGEVRVVVLQNATARDDVWLQGLAAQLLSQFLPAFTDSIEPFPAPSIPLRRNGAVFARLGFDGVEVSREDGVPALFADPVVELCLDRDDDPRPGAVRIACAQDEDADGAPSGVRPVAARVCASDGECPSGWVEANPSAEPDCDDLDARTFPGQTRRFDDPRRDGSFDFDCR